MKKHILLIGAVLFTSCSAGGSSSLNNSYGDIVTYNINLETTYGLKIDSATVNLVSVDGEVVSGVTTDGFVSIDAPKGVYEITVSDYLVPSDVHGYDLIESYKTNSTDTDYTILLESHVKEIRPDEGEYVSVGSLMFDFTFTDCFGFSNALSDILEEKSFVLLNFFYTRCGPCYMEFPHIQAAYENTPDSEVIAITVDRYDTNGSILTDYVRELGLTFPVAYDEYVTTTIVGARNLKYTPTSLYIDRYGRVDAISVGSLSKAQTDKAFEHYTSDDYKIHTNDFVPTL